MLKPKKEIFKKEIKRDPFLETVDRIEANIEKNSSHYLKVFGGIVLFVIIISFLNNSRSLNKQMVLSSIGTALISLDKGDSENAKFQFETLLNEHSGTSGIEVVYYYLGKIEYDQGNYTSSKEYLEQFINSGHSVDLLNFGSVVMISDILFMSGNYLEAIDIIDESIKKSSWNFLQKRLQYEKAKLLIKSGKNSLGIDLLNKINQAPDISASLKSNIETFIGKFGV